MPSLRAQALVVALLSVVANSSSQQDIELLKVVQTESGVIRKRLVIPNCVIDSTSNITTVATVTQLSTDEVARRRNLDEIVTTTTCTVEVVVNVTILGDDSEEEEQGVASTTSSSPTPFLRAGNTVADDETPTGAPISPIVKAIPAIPEHLTDMNATAKIVPGDERERGEDLDDTAKIVLGDQRERGEDR